MHPTKAMLPSRNSEVQREPILGSRSVSHLLKHSFLPKVVNESPFFKAETDHELPRDDATHRGVSDKLLHECFSIWPGFCEEQNPRRVTIDAMYDKGPLPL